MRAPDAVGETSEQQDVKQLIASLNDTAHALYRRCKSFE